MTMHTITLTKSPQGWMARFSDPAIKDVMGTDTIPTAYTAKASAATVQLAIAKLNPGCVVAVATIPE